MNPRDINSKIAVVIDKNGMGTAPQELSHTLIKNYLTITDNEDRIPSYICFYGDGVKLACEGSHVLEELKSIEDKGCKLVVCKTCLLFNNLLENIKVGTVGTMLDIIDIQHNCTKIIHL